LVGMVHVYFHVVAGKPDTGYVMAHVPSSTQLQVVVSLGKEVLKLVHVYIFIAIEFLRAVVESSKWMEMLFHVTILFRL